MKCDKLKPLVFSISDLSFVDEPTPQPNFQNPHDHAVYKATEVDAAIDELKAENERLKKRDENATRIFETTNKERIELRDENFCKNLVIAHHKHKRCLGKAELCESKVFHIGRTPLCDMSEHEYWQYENDFWQRWQKRWQELSEKFSEEK